MAIQLIGGESEYFARRKLATLLGKAPVRTVYADEAELESLPELSGEIGLFNQGAQRLVLVGALANTQLRDIINENFDAISRNLELFLLESGKIDKRSKLYKKLAAQGGVLEYPLESEAERKSELRDYLRKAGIQITQDVEQELMWRLLQLPLPQAILELSKLVHWMAYQQRNLVEMSDLIVITHDVNLEIWELLSLAAKDKPAAIALIENLEQQQVQQQQMLGFLAQQLRQLLTYYYSPNQIPQFIRRRLSAIAAKVTLPRLKQLISKLADLDEKSKTGRLDPRFAVRTFVALV